jgi:uncharacterized protein (DUF2062 family)
MLFGRREPASWRETFRVAIWPRRSWVRSAKYIAKRVLRLTGSPHAIAAGVAAGVFASFTPFLGFHFIIAFAVAYVIAGNFIAAAMGTFFGNPLSFPFIWGSTYSVGHFILSGAGTHGAEITGSAHLRMGEIARADFFEIGIIGILQKISGLWDPVVKPMLVGAIPLGIAAGIVAYVITRWLAIAFRAARKKQLEAKAARLGAVGGSDPTGTRISDNDLTTVELEPAEQRETAAG